MTTVAAQRLTGAALRTRVRAIADIHGLLLTEARHADGRAELQVARQNRWSHNGLPSGRATGEPAIRYWKDDHDACYADFVTKLRYDMGVHESLFTDAFSDQALADLAAGVDLLGLRARMT